MGLAKRLSAIALTLGLAAAAIVSQGLVSAEGFPTIDGQYSGTAVIPGGSSFVLKVTGRGGVPDSGVGAVAVNVAVTNPSAASYLTIFPTGAQRPNAANLVFSAHQTIPNMVVVKVGDGGQISLFNFAGTTDVVVDVLGWFPEGATFTGLTPARLMDTRVGYSTIDGQFAGVGPAGADSAKTLKVAGRGEVPPTGAGAVALNVTVVDPTRSSFLTVWPTGEARPNAANLNYVANQTVPNMVIAKLGTDGQISLFNLDGDAELVVDVLGWFPDAGSFTGLTPARLLDTRAGSATIDSQFSGIGAIGGDSTLELTVVGRGNVPSTGVGAVALNVAAILPTAGSFLTVFPTGNSRPNAANLNFEPGQVVPNMVIVKVGAGGKVSLYNLTGSVDVAVDVMGWFPEGVAFEGLTPARLMDSRTTTPAPAATTTTTTTAPAATTTTAAPVTGTITPGAYCATVGTLGIYNGNTYICSTTNQQGVPYEPPGTARWRRL